MQFRSHTAYLLIQNIERLSDESAQDETPLDAITLHAYRVVALHLTTFDTHTTIVDFPDSARNDPMETWP